MAKNNREYIDNYNKENYIQLSIRLKPEVNDALNEHIEVTHESKNGFISRAIKETINNDTDGYLY